ncbi:hypothetical protein A4A49_54662 [Nicotiana attenuata]|uniref:Uncharacterized protein n=1 Tax=Nicotiana attenuata TaxID=49451 RepID=A0A314L373_NICAT|nr:hypothetical protein A4A49_54662 [Nicotiana attenuata]
MQNKKLQPPSSLSPPPPLSNPPPSRKLPTTREQHHLLAPPPLTEKLDPPVVTLDDHFRKTKATPRIYYFPLSDEQVVEKLKAQRKSIKQ